MLGLLNLLIDWGVTWTVLTKLKSVQYKLLLVLGNGGSATGRTSVHPSLFFHYCLGWGLFVLVCGKVRKGTGMLFNHLVEKKNLHYPQVCFYSRKYFSQVF